MSKVYYFITMTLGITLLMKMAGIPYGGEDLLNWIGLNTDNVFVTTSYFYVAVVVMFGVAATVGSIFSKESSLRATLATGIMGVGVGAFVGILNYTKDLAMGTSQEWVYYVVFLIFGVYIVGFVFSMIEWWGGTG